MSYELYFKRYQYIIKQKIIFEYFTEKLCLVTPIMPSTIVLLFKKFSVFKIYLARKKQTCLTTQ